MTESAVLYHLFLHGFCLECNLLLALSYSSKEVQAEHRLPFLMRAMREWGHTGKELQVSQGSRDTKFREASLAL